MSLANMNQQPATREFMLTVYVEGERMPLSFFVKTTEDLQKLLRTIEGAQRGEEPHAQWELEADRIQITASVNGVSADDLETIIGDAYRSLKAADARDDAELPSTVDEQGRRLTRTIINRARRIGLVTVETPGQEPILIEPSPSQRIEMKTPRRRREILTAWGSVDGRLDLISVHRRPYFAIYEHGSSNRIRCMFPDDWTDTVKEFLSYRVIVEGKLRYRRDGSVATLERPTAIDAVPEPRRSLEEFRGALPGISGELSSADYIRQLRTGELSG